MRITGATTVTGVVGWPVRQSLSPVIHNAWIQALGLDAVYVPFGVRPDGFARWLDGLRAGGARGLNVTMPFKAQALALADRASGEARLAAGANTLVFDGDGGLRADSTDGRGLLAAFAEQAPGWTPESGPVVVLGAGGAATAAVAALVDAGSPEVRVLARDAAKARAAVQPLGPLALALDWGDGPAALKGATALVNATSLGFLGQGGLDLPWASLPAEAVVMDMVSSPLHTQLLQEARTRGLRTVDGLAMLVGQARPSFEAFFGVAPPAEVDVRAACLGEIARREGAA